MKSKLKQAKIQERYVLPEEEWPAELQNAYVRGVSIGCVGGGHVDFTGGETINAHAHVSFYDVHFGWICFKSKDKMTKINCRHELAHLMAPLALEKKSHGPLWFKKFQGLMSKSLLDKIHLYYHLFEDGSLGTKTVIGILLFLTFSGVFAVGLSAFFHQSAIGLFSLIIWLLSSAFFAKAAIDRRYLQCESQ